MTARSHQRHERLQGRDAAVTVAARPSRSSPGTGAPRPTCRTAFPEAAPYLTSEAQVFPPPYEEYWATQNHPGQCARLPPQDLRRVERVDDVELVARSGLARRVPAARARGVDERRVRHAGAARRHAQGARTTRSRSPGQCASAFDIGTGKFTVSRPGSLLDAFCSRCHMPTNYVDNVPLRNVKLDAATGIETALVDPKFNPTSDNGTGVAFATLDIAVPQHRVGQGRHLLRRLPQLRATRDTPFHNYPKAPDSLHARASAGRRATQVVLPQRGRHARPSPIRRSATSATRSAPAPTACRRTRSRSPSASGRCWRATPPPGDDAQHQRRVRPARRRTSSWTPRSTRAMHSALYVARRDVRRVPRRHQRAADQEPARPLGRRLPDRAHVHRVAGQPLRRSPRQRELRSAVQARLPVVPHAAGLRPAGDGADAVQGRQAAADPAARPVATDGKPRPVVHATTSSAATRWCRA